MIDDDTRHPRIAEQAQHQEFADAASPPFSNAAPPPPLRQWRADVLTLTARILFVFGLFMLIPSIIIALSLQEFWRLLVDVPLLVLMGAIAFVPRLGFALRATLLLGLLYGVSVFWLVLSGLVGSGRLYFVLLMVLAALLLNLRGTLLVGLLALLSIGTIYWGFATATLPLPLSIVERMFTPATLTIHWLAQVLVSGVVVAAIVLTINRLQRSFRTAEESRVALQRLNVQLEQRVAERTAELHASQVRLQAIFDNAAVGIGLTDNAGRSIIANARGAQQLGYTPEELAQRSNLDLTYPDDRAETVECMQQLVRGEIQSYRIEKRCVRKDGSIFWADLSVSAVYDDDGAIAYILGIVVDITERKQAEEALRASEERFTTFMTYLPGPAFIHDENGQVVFANRTYCRHLNRPPEQVIGRPFSEQVSPELASYFQAQDQQVLATREACIFEDQADIDGRLQVFLTTKFPVQQADGSIHIGGAAIDITERKQAEEALRASERFVQQMTATIPGILYVYDLILERNVYSNRQMADILGYTPEEVQAMDQDVIPMLLHPDDLPRAAEHRTLQAQVAEGAVLTFEYRMRSREGTWRWLLSREVVFTRTADGQPQQILGIAHDITERKQAEEAYHNLVQFSLQGLMILQAGRVVFANPAIEMIHGYTVTELQAMSADALLLLVHPDDRVTVQQRMQSYMNNGVDAYRHEHRIVCKQGQIRWVEVYVTQVDFRGTIAFQLTFLDITERKQAEQALRESEARFRSLVDHIPNSAVFLVDHDLRFLVARGQGLAEVGRQPVMLEGKTLAGCLSADAYAIMEPIYRATIAGTAPPELEQRFGNRIYRLNPVSMMNEQGEIVAAMLLSQDITEIKQAEEALRRSEQRLQAIFDNAAVGIGLTNNAGQSIIANARGATQLGYTPEELAQRSNLELTHPDDRAETVECMQQLVRGEIQGYRIEKRYFRKDGSIFWADLSVSAIYDDDGQIAYILGIVVDITKRKQLEQQLHQANVLLQEQAIRDSLTGLYNRRYLDKTLPRELQRAARRNQSIGIIMVDVDHFKRINDTYGHAAGDTLLRAVGTFLRHNTRSEDIVCRYGGEEFTLVLPGASPEDACHRAEELRAGIQTLIAAHQGQTLDTVTASLGIAIFPAHGTTADALVRAADQALYQAKHSGRNRVVMADNVPTC